MERNVNDKLLISINDAAATLGVCRNTVYSLIRAKKIKAVPIGRRRMIAAASLRALADGAGGAA
ncbi:MAG: Helix-turn-helix domain [Pseudomonadota bacterium]|jgi:excisionase family DNA binding protein